MHSYDFSSSEKQPANCNNLRMNESFSTCICGTIVAVRPVTLECGHKYHFKCARIHVFAFDDNENESSSQLSEQNYCPLCECSDSLKDLSHVSSQSPSSQQQLHLHNSLVSKSSFKYFTPDASLKQPKQSRYASNYTTFDITASSLPMSTQSPTVNSITSHRVPLADITHSHKQQSQPSSTSFSPGVIDLYSQRKMQQSFRGSQLDGVVRVLGQSLLEQASERQLSLSSSSISDIDVRSSNGCNNNNDRISQLSFLGKSYNNTDSFFQEAASRQSSESVEQSISVYQEQWEYSFNTSMMSCGSNKENVRNILTRRIKNKEVTVSFYEGVSFLSEDCLYKRKNPISNEARFPFIIEVSVEKGEVAIDDNYENNTQPQDILLVVEHKCFSPEERYQLVKLVFQSMNCKDRVRLCWIDFDERTIVNSQCDFFVEVGMADILAKEFMRLQAHKQSRRIIDRASQKEWIDEFVKTQFNGSCRKYAVQHVLLVSAGNEIGFTNHNQNNVIVSQVNANMKDAGEQSMKKIREVHGIRVQWVEVKMKLNEYLNNLSRIELLNAKETDAYVEPKQLLGRVSEMEVEVDGRDGFVGQRDFSVFLRNLPEKRTVRLVFQAVFTLDIQPMYSYTRLFNCDVRYQKLNERVGGQTVQSMNSTIDGGGEDNGSSELDRKDNKNYYKNSVIYSMKGLYMLIEWRRSGGMAKYDRRVARSMWEVESGQSSQLSSLSEYEEVYSRYLRIYEQISKQKGGNSDFEEFEVFRGYYGMNSTWNSKQNQ